VKAVENKFGLKHWMQEVLKEADRAADGFQPDPVHDLRVALRRCRSMAEVFQSLDPDPAWKKMRKAGKEVFSCLGDLRDCHVMMEWIQKLGDPLDPVTQKLLQYSQSREAELKTHAEQALQDFDRKQWQSWESHLSRRAGRLRPDSEPFQCIALERWAEAQRLHKIAMRTRSKVGLHRLRIGIKKFRYVVENFLPRRHEQWKDGLKEIQDLLGEVHDLDVLLDTAIRIGAFAIPDDRARWQERIEAERNPRVEKYREKMLGPDSLWAVWRLGLPQGDDVDMVVQKKLQTWASYYDSDMHHSRHVARLTLQLHDGLTRVGVFDKDAGHSRELLKAAAILHDVGRANGNQDHHKATQRLVRKLDPPFGWKKEDVDMAALIARYHRGTLPHDQRALLSLTPPLQQATKRLAGVLRLADALDRSHEGTVQRLRVTRSAECVIVYAKEFDPESPLAETVARARHLLEITCGMPIVVRSMEQKNGNAG
jgi:CHAD domain-containing protein